MHCTKCGAEIETGAKFCGSCGNKIVETVRPWWMEGEEIVRVASATRCFEGEKPKRIILGSYLGKLVLTNKRLLFISSGKSSTAGSLAGVAVGGALGGAIGAWAGTKIGGKIGTDKLDLEGLKNAGSFDIPIEAIRVCECPRNFLHLVGADITNQSREFAIVFEGASPNFDIDAVARDINNAKFELAMIECPKCFAAIERAMGICPHCGAQIR